MYTICTVTIQSYIISFVDNFIILSSYLIKKGLICQAYDVAKHQDKYSIFFSKS